MVILQQIINGLAIGSVYALVAVGYSLVFGILRLINFSHGSVYTLGAHMTMIYFGLRIGLLPALVLSIITSGLIGVLIDKAALAPLRKRQALPISSLITTIGVAFVITNLLNVWLGNEKKRFETFIEPRIINVGGLQIKATQLLVFGVSIVLLILLSLLVNRSKIGLAMKATEQNRKAAHLMGINVDMVIAFTFFLGAASASIAGSLVGSYYELYYPAMGAVIGIKAFAAAVFGGIGVLYGSIIGGLAVGVIESVVASYIGATYRDAIAFILLVVVLIIRPTGLFGKQAINKV